MFLLPYAYDMWLSLFVSSVFALARAFVSCYLFLFYLFAFVLFPFLATVSFAGYFLARFLLFDFPAFFSSKRVRGLIWFGFVYLVTTAEFVADQLM